ncbi:MAG: hypothetical protein ACK4OI_10385 [Rhizobium oryzihabitans]
MRSEPATTTRPTIRYRSGVARPVRRKATRGDQTDKARFTVTSDWSDPVPATGGEVAVIETFLSEAVSHLLAGTGRG